MFDGTGPPHDIGGRMGPEGDEALVAAELELVEDGLGERRAHAPEEATLDGGVFAEGSVPVEVVGDDVEEEAGVGEEVADGFKLEGADFEDEPVEVGLFADDLAGRDADVAAGRDPVSGARENGGGGGDGGGFAEGSGDGEDVAVRGSVPPAEFEFGDEGEIRFAEGDEPWGIEGDAGADDDLFGGGYVREREFGDPSVDFSAEFATEGGRGFAGGGGVRAIEDDEVASGVGEEPGGGLAGFAES